MLLRMSAFCCLQTFAALDVKMSKFSTRKNNPVRIPKYTKQDEEIFKAVNAQINSNTTYDPWSRKQSYISTVVAVKTPRASTGSAKSQHHRYAYKKVQSANEKLLERRRKILECKIALKKDSLKALLQREAELLDSNGELIKYIEEREEFTASHVSDMLNTYSKCRVGAINLSEFLKQEKEKAITRKQFTTDKLANEILDMESWIEEYEDLLAMQKRELLNLQTFKVKEYNKKFKEISQLEKWLMSYKEECENNYEDLQSLLKKDLEMHINDEKKRASLADTMLPQNLLEKGNICIAQVEQINSRLTKDINHLQEIEEQLSAQISFLKADIKTLNQQLMQDHSTSMYTRSLICTRTLSSDSDIFTLDIPRRIQLPI